MAWQRFGILIIIALQSACASRAGPADLVVPLSTEAALSSPESPGIATRLSFSGESAWFVFDTGAGAHTLAEWFVDAAGLQVDSTFGDLSASDATGRRVSLRVISDAYGELEGGGALHIAAAVAVSFPPEFEAVRIGGLLNPQLLAGAGDAVVLDLRVPELRVEPFEWAVRRLGATRLPTDEARFCTSTEVAIPNLTIAVLARSDAGYGWLQLDTGADVTTIVSESGLVQGRPLETGGEVMGVAGVSQEYLVTRDLALSLGDQRAATDAWVVESTGNGCGPDGLLGLDVLAACALVMGPRDLALACSP